MLSQKLSGLLLSLLLVSTLILGFLIGKAYDVFPYFEVGKSVELLDVFSILISLFVAYWVSVYFINKSNLGHAEQDLLYSIIAEVNDESKTAADLFSSKGVAITESASQIKRLRRKMKRLEILLTKVSLKVNMEFNAKAMKQVQHINKLATMTPIYNESDEIVGFTKDRPMIIEDGTIQYSTDRLDEIDNEFEKLGEIMFDIQIEIIHKCNT